MFRRAQGWSVIGLLCAGFLAPLSAVVANPASSPPAADPAATEAAIARLAPRYRQWLAEVAILISANERQAFLALAKDYQRDEFMRRFWLVRDPHPETARNELAESWKERAELVRARYEGFEEDRARILLLNGEPQAALQVSCLDLLRPLEIWTYPHTERIREGFSAVFYSPTGSSRGPFRLWYPSQGLEALLTNTIDLFGKPEQIFQAIDDRCSRSTEILAGLSSAIDWGRVESSLRIIPRPNEEWLQTFAGYSTDLPSDAATFTVDLALSFPGRNQSRTVVQGLLTVPVGEVPAASSSALPRSFLVDGEVLRGDELFEHFRYRFSPRPAEAIDGRLPLVFQRSLRPGDYKLILKVEDLDHQSFFRDERALAVPAAPTPPPEVAAAPEMATSSPGEDARLAEANRGLKTGDCSLQILETPARLLIGKARFEALATCAGIARTRFDLDGKTVLAKKEPPYSVEIDLGNAPALHRLRAVAQGERGEELAADEVLLNAGPHRFAVRLLEPRPGKRYDKSLRAAVTVDVPEGDRLDRVEIYLGEDLLATLYQPPFTQPILLPEGGTASYVRAVAFLADGSSTEDAVVINTPDFAEQVRVSFVELYTSVLDRRSRPVDDLTRDDFTVLENGQPQPIQRFERVRDQPIYAGLLLDTSTSMLEELDGAVKGALTFFETVMTPKDRAAVITFNEAPRLAVRFTNDREVLAGGLVGLKAEGETALYDSLIYGLYYFSGIKGKRALIVLSDGEDAGSRYRFEDVIEYGRRTGVSIYAIGLNLGSNRQSDVRLKLRRLADETGGLAFFVDGASGLTRAYATIEAELRSQYMLAYQSTSSGDDHRFREVEVKLKDSGLEARTIHGYYP